MKFKFEQHCTEENLEQYALNHLDEQGVAEMEEHLLICDGCRVRLDETDRFLYAMRNGAALLRQESRDQVRSSWFSLDWLRMPSATWAAAAVAVCAVALISLTQIHRVTPDGHAEAITLVAERGAATSVPAHRALDLKMDTRGLNLGSQTRVELVDAEGKIVERATAIDNKGTLEMYSSANLSDGSYFVRLYTPGNPDPVREFAVEAK